MRGHTQPPGKVTYGDSYSIGQIAQMWGKPASFVRGLINDDLLTLSEQGLVTNSVLRRFYLESGDLLAEPAEA